MQGQTVKHSWFEAVVNVLIGFWVNYGANLLILPLFGFHSLTPGKNLIIGMLYTVVSLVRSFILRRAFNRLHIFQYRRDRIREEEIPLGEEASGVVPSTYRPE